MAENKAKNAGKAQIDFICSEPECGGIVKFNLTDCVADDFQALCPKCHRPYAFDAGLKDKLHKLHDLILALRIAEPILGDCNVAVATPAGEVKLPYALLLTRLNTMLTLDLNGKKVDFHLWIEPTSQETFR